MWICDWPWFIDEAEDSVPRWLIYKQTHTHTHICTHIDSIYLLPLLFYSSVCMCVL